jgi:hypothetical protein
MDAGVPAPSAFTGDQLSPLSLPDLFRQSMVQREWRHSFWIPTAHDIYPRMNTEIFQLTIQLDAIPKCLFWHDDKLIDPQWGKSYEVPNPTPGKNISVHVTDLNWRIGFDFDGSVSRKVGTDHWLVLYQRLGTKGVIFKNLKNVREIDRSYYHSDTHEFPVAIVVLPSGKVGIVHCPVDCGKIEIDDADTGERLTTREGDGDQSYFHSRLNVSPDGSKVCIGGWLWHPIEYGRYFDLASVMSDPSLLDTTARILHENGKDSEFDEVENIAFRNNESVLVSLQNTYEDDQLFSQLCLWSPLTATWAEVPRKCETLGLIYCKGDLAYSFYDHIKLVNVQSGEVITRWSDIKTGTQRGCYADLKTTPVHAFDPVKFRLAVATESGISLFHPI